MYPVALIQDIMTLPLTNKTKLVNLYKKERDPKVKERLLLIIRVRCNQKIPYRVVKDMNRSQSMDFRLVEKI
jgi:hypothetical protein